MAKAGTVGRAEVEMGEMVGKVAWADVGCWTAKVWLTGCCMGALRKIIKAKKVEVGKEVLEAEMADL